MKSSNETKIYIVPTRRGFAFGLWTIILLITGAVMGNHSLLGISGFLVTLGLLTMHLTHLNLARLQIQTVELGSGFAGEKAVLRVKANNPLETPLVSVQIEGQIFNVPAGERWLESLSIPLVRRGIQKINSIKIASVYPLGLFYAWTNWEGEAASFVYPARDTEHYNHPMQTASDARGFGAESEFEGHRKAVEGDSARRLNWKALAKSQKLLFKIYERETEESLVLKWESTSQAEEKLKLFSTIIDHCRISKRPVGLILPDQQFPVRSGEDHYIQCLESLAVFQV